MSFEYHFIRSSSIDMLNLISAIFSRYCQIILFVFGGLGLILNTIIFTRKIFRQNSCVHYFLASTIANYFVVFFILPSRILSDGFYVDPGRYSLFYCKIRFYTYFTAKSLASWFIVLACFDRRMSSSQQVQRRAFARLTVSRWMIALTTILGLLFYSHVLIYYEIDNDQRCDARAGAYRLFNDIVYLIGYSLAPPLFMFIFGIWTIGNTRRLHRIVPRFGRRLAVLNHRDHTLMLMLFLQVILITITAVPHAVQKLYSTLTIDVPKDEFRKAADKVFIIIVRTISFFNHSCTFYILTLSGRMFRKELGKILRKILCQTQRQRRRQSRRLGANLPLRQVTQTFNPSPNEQPLSKRNE